MQNSFYAALLAAGFAIGGAGLASAETIIKAPDGYVQVPYENLVASDLRGVEVYSSAGELLGKISAIQVNADNKILDFVVDTGTKTVAVKSANIPIFRGTDGTLRAYVSMSAYDLNQLPEYKI